MRSTIIFAYINHLYYDLLVGDDLSKSYIDLWSSTSVFCLKSTTLSLLLRVALICSSVSTNFSSSLFNSLFYCSNTFTWAYNAAISAFRSPFLSIIPELLNLTSSSSFLMTITWSSLLLFLVSRSNNSALNSLFFCNSISLYLNNVTFSSFYLSNCLY